MNSDSDSDSDSSSPPCLLLVEQTQHARNILLYKGVAHLPPRPFHCYNPDHVNGAIEQGKLSPLYRVFMEAGALTMITRAINDPRRVVNQDIWAKKIWSNPAPNPPIWFDEHYNRYVATICGLQLKKKKLYAKSEEEVKVKCNVAMKNIFPQGV